MAKAIKMELSFDKGWQKFNSAVDPKRFQANLDANMRKATQFNGMMFRAEIRRRIKSRRYAANTPLTILIKRSATPLVDDADLFGAITSKDLDPRTVFIGILRATSGPDGKPMANLAELLHEGGTIPVTESMRNLFMMLYEVGQGRRDIGTLEGRALELAKQLKGRIKMIRPIRESTKVLHIPPRRFISTVMEDKRMLKKAENNWRKAMKATMKDQVSGAKAKSSSSSGGVPAPGVSPKAKSSAKSVAKKARDRSAAARKGWQTRRKKQTK